jgi:hypothetical protein
LASSLRRFPLYQKISEMLTDAISVDPVSAKTSNREDGLLAQLSSITRGIRHDGSVARGIMARFMAAK